MPIVEISRVTSESDGDGTAEWNVSIRRLSQQYSVSTTVEPRAGDIPADVRDALGVWLARARG